MKIQHYLMKAIRTFGVLGVARYPHAAEEISKVISPWRTEDSIRRGEESDCNCTMKRERCMYITTEFVSANRMAWFGADRKSTRLNSSHWE